MNTTKENPMTNSEARKRQADQTPTDTLNGAPRADSERLAAIYANLGDIVPLLAADCRRSLPTKGAMQEALGRVSVDATWLLDELARVTIERDEARGAIERVRQVCAEPDDTQWWPVAPYMDPPNDDEVIETRVVDVARVLAALDAAPTEEETP